MRKYFIVFLMLVEACLAWSLHSITLADAPLAKELTISQLKVTGDEYLVLHNATSNNLQLGNFWLQYFNDFDLTHTGVSNNSAQLPSVWLQPGQEIMLSTGTAANCGPVWVSKLSFTLKDSAGMIQVLNLSQTGGIIGYKAEDQVSWSSKTTDPVDVKGVSASAQTQIYSKAAAGWQAVTTPPGCTASSTTISGSTNTPDSLTQSTTSPPSILLSQSNEANSTAIPDTDSGLMAPQISEILANPASPKTDANDEFVELYNPNDKPFDLSGFKLKAGESATYNYTFPTGQFSLQPHEFKAFYSSVTNLSLSNTSSKIWLLDPSGATLAQSETYNDAKDDYAWILSDGVWQWSSAPSPNARNIISASSASPTVLSTAQGVLPAATYAGSSSYPILEISELLPNPKSPQKNATDEFIELYNPNKEAVDLTGYVLVVGDKDNHKYIIKSGSIAPGAYMAFTSATTKLSMSNSSGHGKLLAPDSSTLDTTGEYDKATAGQAWIFAQGKWQWTNTPTPGKANVLSSTGKVLGANTVANRGSSTNNLLGSSGNPSGAAKSLVHPAILAGIGGLAVLYALYEYRHDLANALYKLRRH